VGKPILAIELFQMFNSLAPGRIKNFESFIVTILKSKKMVYSKNNKMVRLKEWPTSDEVNQFSSIHQIAIEIMRKIGKPVSRKDLYEIFKTRYPGKTKDFKSFGKALLKIRDRIGYNQDNEIYLV